MKRALALICTVILMFAASGCSTRSQLVTEPVNFYYRTVEIQYGEPDGVIIAEQRSQVEYAGDFEQLISVYLKGPREDNHISPFPAGIYLVQLILGADRVYIKLSSHLSMLTGADLMIACACLSKTILEMTGVASIEISVESGLLDNQSYLVFTEADFSFLDTYADSLNK